MKLRGMLLVCSLVLAACGSSSKSTDGGVDASGTGGTGGNGGTSGNNDGGTDFGAACNQGNGNGCLCTSQTAACPLALPNNACIQITDPQTQKTYGNYFCSNRCTPDTASNDCALLNGQAGQGLCALTLATDGSGGTNSQDMYCVILCGAGNNGADPTKCPTGFVGMTFQQACVCVPPS